MQVEVSYVVINVALVQMEVIIVAAVVIPVAVILAVRVEQIALILLLGFVVLPVRLNVILPVAQELVVPME